MVPPPFIFVPPQAGLQTLQALGPEMRRALSCDLEGDEGPGGTEEEHLSYAVSPAPNCHALLGHAHIDHTLIGHAHPSICPQPPETLYGSAPSPPGLEESPKAASPEHTEGEDPAPLPHLGSHRHGGR